MQNNVKLQGHGFFRKTKVGLASGIVLGAAALTLGTGASVSADEVTTPTTPTTEVATTGNPATNLVEAQPEAPQANVDMAGQAGSQTGALTSEVTSQELNTAVDNAKNAGVDVKTGDSVSHDTVEKANQDLANQKSAVEKATADAKANAAAIAAAEAKNAEIAARNKAEADRVAQENAAAQKQYEESTSTIDISKFKNAADNTIAYQDLPLTSTGYTASGSTYHLKPVSTKGIVAVSEGDLKNPTVYLMGDVDESRVIKSIIFGDVEPTGPGVVQKGVAGWDDVNAYNYNQDGSTTQLWLGEVGKTIVIPNAITMLDGTVKDAEIVVTTKTDGLTSDPTKFALWNQNGAINTLDGFRAGGANPESDGTRLQIRVAGADREYIWPILMYDIDGGQYARATSKNNDTFFLAYGGGMNAEGDSDENLGFTYGNNMDSNALNGRASSPDGTILLFQVGQEYELGLYNTPGGNGSAVARADFGADSQINLQVIKTPTPPTPQTPTEEPLVEVPAKGNYTAEVHPVFVKQTPANVKDVVNEDGVSVNGKLVPKGSTQTWELKNAALQAGREEVTAYVMDDPAPADFLVDMDATKEKNAGAWVVTMDEDGKLQFVATDLTLGVLNANRAQAVNVPVAYFVGSPQNDGGTYQNTFTTTVKTPKGEYKVVSNTPVIYTPGNDPENPRTTPDGENPTPDDNIIQPKKDVIDPTTGKSIDGKSVLPNTELNYVLTQNFDQYKGMEASKDSIAKGFVYIDDYLDEALDGKSMTVQSIKAANGDDVTQLLEMYHVLSQDAIDEKLQAIIKESGISPVGEFYMWVAKDPQEFYKAYVQKGLDITYNLSFKIKETFKEGDITNGTYQIDFGNGYYSNIVVNNLPKMEVHKDVLDKEGGKSINNGTVGLGQEATYQLEGWVVPANRGYDLFEYKFVDQLQNTHDMFLRDSVVAKVDIKLADGTVIEKGSDLSKYTEVKYNEETGLYELAFKEDFLKQIPRDSEFGADVFLVVKRIAAGEVENQYTLYVNGNPVKSEVVRTVTPEPAKPVSPATPSKEVKTLPNTGTEASAMTLVGAIMASLSGAGAFITKRKRR